MVADDETVYHVHALISLLHSLYMFTQISEISVHNEIALFEEVNVDIFETFFDAFGLSGTLNLSQDVITALSSALAGVITAITATTATVKAAVVGWWVPFVGKVKVAAAIAVTGVVVYQTYALMVDVRVAYNWMTQELSRNHTHQSGTFSVYVILNRNTNLIHYVGRTRDWTSREYYHRRRPRANFPVATFDMLVVRTNMTEAEATALEQTLITANVLLALGNKINAISSACFPTFINEFNRLQNLMSPSPPTA